MFFPLIAIFWPKIKVVFDTFSNLKFKNIILAQKFKLDDLRNFVKIKFLDKNMTFDTVCAAASLLRAASKGA